jgi:para-nitrobenzyl esterase
MADMMARYWLAFAETGNPNSPGLLEWPKYDETTDQHLKLDVPLSIGSNWRSGDIDFVAGMMAAQV